MADTPEVEPAPTPVERRCVCGHTIRQHELRSGGLLGCYIFGCNCIDFDEAAA